MTLHFHTVVNVSGYMPESDNGTFADFDSAKRSLIGELLYSAENAETEDIAENCTHVAEDVNLWSGPDTVYVELIDSEHCIPTAFSVVECSESECGDDDNA